MDFRFPSQYCFEIGPKVLEYGDSLRRGFENLFLVDEDHPSAALNQWPQAFAHAPANVAKDLQPVRTGHKEGDAVIPQDADGFGKTVEGLEIKAGEIELLQLFFRKHVSGYIL